MLARHLLFLATRRPHSALLAGTAESITPEGTNQQPPPYIGPPQPKDPHKTQQYHINLPQTQYSKNQQIYHRNQQIQEQDRLHNQKVYHQNYDNRTGHAQIQRNFPQAGFNQRIYVDNRQNPQYDDKGHEFFERHRQNYSQNQQIYNQQMCQAASGKNHDYYSENQADNQQFYTLPSRRPQREVEPPRSVTPDITRGLARGRSRGCGPLSSMHMLARHGQKPIPADHSDQSNQFGNVDQQNLKERTMDQLEARSRLMQSQNQKPPPVDVRNRFSAPLALAAIGYRFFAASPVHSFGRNSPTKDNLKQTPISPIGPGGNNGFKSSTPSGRSTPTVAERLAFTTGRNTPVQNTSGRSTPTQNTSGTNTPPHLVLSPTKSTMSNEELFAAIHKSKKRLNIRDDGENLSPSASVASLAQIQAGDRHSWSPESHKTPKLPQNVPPQSATSRLDFKRLLLQQSVKTGPTRLSAAEQLKLSKQHQNQQQQEPQEQQFQQSQQSTPPVKVLSPRAAWRFQTPRTDVLSSTIMEDAAAEEKAMKPSPENPAPISRLNPRRQLDLCSDLPEHLRKQNYESTSGSIDYSRQSRRTDDNRVSRENPIVSVQSSGFNNSEQHWKQDNTKFNVPNATLMQEQDNKLSMQGSGNVAKQNVLTRPTGHRSQILAHVAASGRNQMQISTSEARRINNQLARAQFLAGMPGKPIRSSGQNAPLHKQFRARSESPQHSVAQNVSRSPSAPTLETAL